MLVFAALMVGAAPLAAAEGLIRLADPLDEPESYCVDVPGFRDRVRLDAPLMAHTCKPGAPDELFTLDHPGKGQVYMRAYSRCMEASSREAGAQLLLKPCSGVALQKFSFGGAGLFRLADSALCLAVAGGEGTPTGGPSHLRRDLALVACDGADHALSTWESP